MSFSEPALGFAAAARAINPSTPPPSAVIPRPATPRSRSAWRRVTPPAVVRVSAISSLSVERPGRGRAYQAHRAVRCTPARGRAIRSGGLGALAAPEKPRRGGRRAGVGGRAMRSGGLGALAVGGLVLAFAPQLSAAHTPRLSAVRAPRLSAVCAPPLSAVRAPRLSDGLLAR